jgi:Ser/Thr protein kinase RdoA (MazF antagonist)
MTVTETGTTRPLAAASQVAALAARSLGAPVHLEVLKHKLRRRCTWRATGPAGTAIAKAYASDRAGTVAARVAALDDGHPAVTTPSVLDVDEARRVVILTDVAGTPWSDPLHAGDHQIARAAGVALATWHRRWAHCAPPTFARHTARTELAALERQATRVAGPRRDLAVRAARALVCEWPSATVVHRDLYEDQILVIDRHRIGLIDLDDAAAGPAELDVGNVLAHLRLRAMRDGTRLTPSIAAFLEGYESRRPLDHGLLRRCERLTTLRLACIHADLGEVVFRELGDGHDA